MKVNIHAVPGTQGGNSGSIYGGAINTETYHEAAANTLVPDVADSGLNCRGDTGIDASRHIDIGYSKVRTLGLLCYRNLGCVLVIAFVGLIDAVSRVSSNPKGIVSGGSWCPRKANIHAAPSIQRCHCGSIYRGAINTETYHEAAANTLVPDISDSCRNRGGDIGIDGSRYIGTGDIKVGLLRLPLECCYRIGVTQQCRYSIGSHKLGTRLLAGGVLKGAIGILKADQAAYRVIITRPHFPCRGLFPSGYQSTDSPGARSAVRCSSPHPGKAAVTILSVRQEHEPHRNCIRA